MQSLGIWVSGGIDTIRLMVELLKVSSYLNDTMIHENGLAINSLTHD